MAGDNLEARIAVLERDGEWIKRSLGAIETNTAETAKSIRQLVTIEERTLTHAGAIERCFGAVDAVCKRVKVLEDEMPTLKLARGWVFGFVAWALVNTGGLFWLLLR